MVASGIATSVVSAAVIEGNLILGLSNGSIIDCGTVQGPMGLTGDQGPMGATGRPGLDGNTIHTVEGAPSYDLGRDGDFAINTAVWEIYGPKASGQWGTGTPLRGNKRNGKGDADGMNVMGGPEGGDSGGGGRLYTTSNLPLSGTGRITAPGGNIIPEGTNLHYQSNANKWIVDSLSALDEALPINEVDELPDEGKYNGDMVLFDGALFVWSEDSWIQVGGAVDFSAAVHVGDTPPDDPKEGALWWSSKPDELTLYIYDGNDWVPASPPVSLDGVEASLANVDEALMIVNRNIAANKKDIDDAVYEFQPYKDKIDLLEQELDKLEGVYIDVVLDYKFGFAPQRPPQPGCGYLRVGDDASSQKPTYKQAQWLNVSPVDLQGNSIDWMSVNKGDVIVVENLDGTGFGVYVNEGPIEAADDWIKFQMVLDESVENNGVGKPVEYEKIRIKVMDSIGLSNYVRKSGDTITGQLFLNPTSTGNPLVINANDNADSRSVVLNVRGKTKEDGKRVPIFSVVADGRVGIDDEVTPTQPWHVTHKKYVDSKARTSEIELSQLAEDGDEGEVDPELRQRIGQYENPTQEDLNNEIGWSLFNQRRKETRTSTNLDLLQNTIVDGQWMFIETQNPESELPQIGDFFVLDADGKFTQEWSEARTLRINGGDGRAGDLSDVRRGTQWIFQDVALNTFAHYITNNVEFLGSVEGGQFVVEAEITPINNKAMGGPVVGKICEVKTILPRPCIPTKDGRKPVVDDDGYLWYDEQTKKLYVSDWDDDQEPNGEAKWIEVGGSGAAPDLSDYLKKSGGQMTGNLEFKATGKDEYWSYIRALRPSSWSTTENTHGLILDIGDTNSYKQQFKITGRGGRELFKLNDDGSASATLKGRLNVTEKLSVNGDKVLTQSDLPEQDLFWKWVPDPTNTVQERHIYWLEKQAGDFQFNISTVAQNGVIDIPDFETVNVSHPFSIYTKDADGIKMIAIGTLKNIAVNSTSSSLMQYLDVRVAKTDMVLWRPSYIAKEAPVICKIGGFIP